MLTATATQSQNPSPVQVDAKALKARQQGAWSSSDYTVISTTLQIVGEELCEALDIRSTQKATWPPATATSRLRPRGAGAR
jgi:hypothetical protein